MFDKLFGLFYYKFMKNQLMYQKFGHCQLTEELSLCLRNDIAIIYEKIQQLLFTSHMSAKIIFTILLLVCLANTESFKSDYYTLKANASCTVADCALCPLFNNSCTQCDPSFYTINTSSCIPCSSNVTNCADCTFDNGTFTFACSTCDANYVLVNPTTCTLCSTAVANCISCTHDTGTQTFTCITCDVNTVLSNNTCVDCATFNLHCTTCNTDGTCAACDPGYFPNADNSACLLCGDLIPGCSQCTTAAGNLTCDKCITDFFLENNTCINCTSQIPRCTACNTVNNTCDACAADYFRNASGKLCTVCIDVIDNCATCNATSENGTTVDCLTCVQNYFFINASYCQPCGLHIVNCDTCDTVNDACLTCVTRFYLDSTCQPCNGPIPNCVACSGTTANLTCSACDNALVLYQNNCKTCSTFIPDCTRCNQESLLLNITCIQCGNGKVLALDGHSCLQSQNSSINLIIAVAAITGGIAIIGIIFIVVCIIRKKRLDNLKPSLLQKTSNDPYFISSNDLKQDIDKSSQEHMHQKHQNPFQARQATPTPSPVQGRSTS